MPNTLDSSSLELLVLNLLLELGSSSVFRGKTPCVCIVMNCVGFKYLLGYLRLRSVTLKT